MAFDYHRNKLRRHYEEDFSAGAYLTEFYNPDNDIPPWDLYMLRKLHETFRKGILNGGDCLEVGCGPTVHHVASVSRVCDSISFSDISRDNLRFLKHYRDVQPVPTQEFKHLFHHIARLEGYENLSEGSVSIESRLKVKIRDVQRCDVSDTNMLESNDKLYDVIISCACIEFCSVTFDDFIQYTKNLAKYLKPRGYLVLTGFMGGNYIKIEKDVFPCLQFDLALVNRSLRKAGLEVSDMGEDTLSNKDGLKGITNNTKCFFAVARKE